MIEKNIQHLYGRAGFGVLPKDLTKFNNFSRRQVVNSLFDFSKTISPLEVDISEFVTIDNRNLDRKSKRELRKKSKHKIKEYNAKWLVRMGNSQECLREKMTLFWCNHFVCKNDNILFVQKYNNTLRTNALGHFGDFVKAISKEAAMLQYLNNKQNRKLQPNENFARELMELFTLGLGRYSEMDIKESARAFTGYNHNSNGVFEIRSRHHDNDVKTFLGQTGNFSGDDIINIILEQKQCARFICQKIYTYFVNEKINALHVEELTTLFYEDYDIERIMRYLFNVDWFYFEENIGNKIKSPVELLVGMHKIVPMTFDSTQDVLKTQKLLGQVLLFPPNVAGWKGGRSWIDSNTIMLRLKLGSILLGNTQISVKPKGEFEDTYKEFYDKKKHKKMINVTANWNAFEKYYENATIADLTTLIINTHISDGTKLYLEKLSQTSKQEYCIQLMSLPEYQMC